MLNLFKKTKKEAVKIEKMNNQSLKTIIGGAVGDPIPGVDVSLEQNPGSTIRKR